MHFQETQAQVDIKHRTTTNKIENTTQKTKQMSNTDFTTKQNGLSTNAQQFMFILDSRLATHSQSKSLVGDGERNKIM